jgi:hypothetical protein
VIRSVLRVTLDTKTHIQSVYVVNLVHLSHVAVTLRALKTALNVPFMGEMHILGHRGNFYPGDRLFIIPILSYLCYLLLNIYGSAVEIVFNVAPCDL